MKIAAVVLLSVLVAAGCRGPAANDSGAPGEKPGAPAPAAQREPAAATPVPTPVPTPEPIVVPAGTTLVLVFGSTVSSATARAGDSVTARLGKDVKDGEKVVLEADSEVRGHVVSAKRSGKVKGRAELRVAFDTIEVKGRPYAIDVTSVAQTATSDKGRDAKVIGGAAGAGAIIGGIADGGSGALKGSPHRRGGGDGRRPAHSRQGSGLRAGLAPPREARTGPSPPVRLGPFVDEHSPEVRPSPVCRRPPPSVPSGRTLRPPRGTTSGPGCTGSGRSRSCRRPGAR